MHSKNHNSSEQTQTITKIASSIGAKTFFLSQQQKNLDQWATKSNQIFKYTSQILKNQYQLKSITTLQSYSTDYQTDYLRCKKQFDAFCILNRKVQKKNNEIQNLAAFYNKKNIMNQFFQLWKSYTNKNKYIRTMDQKSDKYHKHRIMKNIMKQWLKQTMQNNKIKIKNQVLQKTQLQVARIQSQYQKLIKSLQQTLQKKLNQLKKQQQQHKLLHDKYQAMYSRAPLQKV